MFLQTKWEKGRVVAYSEKGQSPNITENITFQKKGDTFLYYGYF